MLYELEKMLWENGCERLLHFLEDQSIDNGLVLLSNSLYLKNYGLWCGRFGDWHRRWINGNRD